MAKIKARLVSFLIFFVSIANTTFITMLRNFSVFGIISLILLVFCSLTPADTTQNENQERSRCSNYVDVKTDTITGIVRIMAKEKMKLLDKDGKMLFDMMMIRHRKEFTLHFKGIKPVCFRQNTKVLFEFTDDSVSEIKSSNQKNCKGVMSVNMGGIFGDARMVKKLSSSTLRNIKFTSQEDSYQIDLNIDQKERILNTMDCFIYN